MKYISLILGLILQIIPRSMLKKSLYHLHGVKFSSCSFESYFSGRVALSSIAQSTFFKSKVVIIPKYVCNIVPMAFARSGWKVVYYDTDEQFVFEAEEIEQLVIEHNASALVVVPLYGSHGGLPWCLSEEGQLFRKRLGLFLVVDICQDASFLEYFNKPFGKDWAIVSSFNDKSFPGIMGGVAWSDQPLKKFSNPSFLTNMSLVKLLIKRLLTFRPKGSKSGFEISYGIDFPYNFLHLAASNLQLALGLIGFVFLPYWKAKRSKNLAIIEIDLAKFPHARTSPFFLSEKKYFNRRSKGPYAMPDNPNESYRPHLNIYHNKGFDDR